MTRKNTKKKKMKTVTKVAIWLGFILLFILSTIGSYGYKLLSDVKGMTGKIYTQVKDQEEIRENPIDLEKGESFSVLLLGIDIGGLDRDEQGRSDSLMVLTINPNSNKTTMVSIPRDTYTEIVGHGTTDKINHAYAFGGASMTINTVQQLLGIPIDYYVEVDMKGIKDIVDVVGGVDVINNLDFTYEGAHFPVGSQHLDGELALKYARMRYEDPAGDYGRQGRQRQIIESIIKKSVSLSTVTNYQNILKALENNMKTNLQFDEMMDIQSKYRDAVGNINPIQMKGAGEMIDGVSYQIIAPEELSRISSLLKEQLGL